MAVHDELRERIADLAHQEWSAFVHSMGDACVFNPDGSITISDKTWLRWERQMQTPFYKLSDAERVTSYTFADRVLALIEEPSHGR